MRQLLGVNTAQPTVTALHTCRFLQPSLVCEEADTPGGSREDREAVRDRGLRRGVATAREYSEADFLILMNICRLPGMPQCCAVFL